MLPETTLHLPMSKYICIFDNIDLMRKFLPDGYMDDTINTVNTYKQPLRFTIKSKYFCQKVFRIKEMRNK